MATLAHIFDVSLMVVLAGLTWWVPRRSGIRGMFRVQGFVFIGFLTMAALGAATGTLWENYEFPEVVISFLVQAVLFNCLVLPIALFALWRHRPGLSL